jgi:glyoxylase-like metal-dependent hydrolase (beta-lactamase superfamily II)
VDVYNLTADADVFTCNAYLALGSEPTLVDAGAMPGVVEAVDEHARTLDKVVLTHQHGDHVAELDAVLDAFDADLYAYGDHPRRDHGIDDGDRVRVGDRSFEVLYTPGHADDHVCLVGEEVLFSGDVFVHDDGAFEDGSFGRTDGPDQDRERLIESLHDLRAALPDTVDRLYAGHGSAFEGDVHAVLDRAIERAERREPKYPDE